MAKFKEHMGPFLDCPFLDFKGLSTQKGTQKGQARSTRKPAACDPREQPHCVVSAQGALDSWVCGPLDMDRLRQVRADKCVLHPPHSTLNLSLKDTGMTAPAASAGEPASSSNASQTS